MKRNLYKCLNVNNFLSREFIRASETKWSWVSINTIDFYIKIRQVFLSLETYLGDISDPMRIYDWEFLWRDDENYLEPTAIRAPEYIKLSFKLIRRSISNKNIFVECEPFPDDFKVRVKIIFKKLFRICGYFLTDLKIQRELERRGKMDLLKKIFKNLVKFVVEHKLLKKRDLLPMSHWINFNFGKSAMNRKRNVKQSQKSEDEKLSLAKKVDNKELLKKVIRKENKIENLRSKNKILHEELETLKSQVEVLKKRKMEATINRSSFANSDISCKICYAAKVEYALNCGHVFCKTCSNKLIKCPFCNKYSYQKLKLYI